MQVDSQVEATDERGSEGGRAGGGGGGGGGRGNEENGLMKRGTKRGASDSNLTDNERFDLERFEKRLRLLSLRNSDANGTTNDQSHLYTPVSNHGGAATAQPQSANGQMQVDDRPDRVYIHDLDAELADDSSDEKERLIFLPDIEKHFSKIPQQVLAGADDGNRELVLYDIPRSLTVDVGHDSVRKAIIEARQRAREKAIEESRRDDPDTRGRNDDIHQNTETAHWYNGGFGGDAEVDPDAMDMG